jgi:fucose permease
LTALESESPENEPADNQYSYNEATGNESARNEFAAKQFAGISSPPARRWLRSGVIYLGFAGTGVGMSLPGSVLPALLTRLALNDGEAGFFFFLGWLGTAIGALLVQRSRTASIALASALVAIGSMGLAYSTHLSCFAAMTVYGIGLGMAMTAMSLHQAAIHGAQKAMELNRLNLIWAIGACAGPSLGAHSLRIASVRSIYSIISIFFVLFTLWVLAFEKDVPQAERSPSALRRWSLRLWPLPILCVIFLPTGIEASMGAWIAAYVQRSHQAIATTVTAGSSFWLGLLLSRAFSAALLAKRQAERGLLFWSLLLVVAGAALLMATTATASTLPAIFLIGFGLGPVYPLLLAIALEFSEATPIFFLAGLGSAFMPWLTGIVSAQTHSLRIGLVVPVVAAALMLVLGLRVSGLVRPGGPYQSPPSAL